MPVPSRLITPLRRATALAALTLMATAIWLLSAMFILKCFGLMAILLALALFSAATILWWLLAEGHNAETRTRMRHIVSGALLLAAVGVIHAIMSSDRLEAGLYAGLLFEGPVGFIIGGNLGAIYSLLRLRGTSAA